MKEESTDTTLESFMSPVWAGGWVLARIVWCVAAAVSLVPRASGIGDAYGASDMVFTHRLLPLNDYLFVTEPMAWSAWACGLGGIALVAYGGRGLRPGVLLWFLGNWFLLANEALNIKAHDRLFLWTSLALLLSPAWERGLANKYRSPLGRYVLLVLFCALYGSSGLTKLLYESSWLGDGTALAYTLVERNFGGTSIGSWISGQPWLVAPLAWVTVLFELSFPFLVWFRSVNPWLLALGLALHAGIQLALDVGAFFWVVAVSYPVLLHPDCARQLWTKAARRIRAVHRS